MIHIFDWRRRTLVLPASLRKVALEAFSAFLNRRPEDIHVQSVVIAELELRDIERQILFADLVERPDHAALDERPETLDRLSVDRADDVLLFGVVNRPMVELALKARIALPFIGAKQADAVRHGLVDESGQRLGFRVLNNARDDAALAAHGAHDDCLVASRAARPDTPAALVLMPVLGLPANERLVDFYDPGELVVLLTCYCRSPALAPLP